MSVLWATNILDKTTELVAQGGQDLVFVLDRFFCTGSAIVLSGVRTWTDDSTVKERYELISGALRAKSKSNGRQAADCVQSEQDIVVLCRALEKRISYDKSEDWRTLSSSMRTAMG